MLLVLDRRLVGGGSTALEKPPLFLGMSPKVTRLGEGPGFAVLPAGSSAPVDSERILVFEIADAFPEGMSVTVDS